MMSPSVFLRVFLLVSVVQANMFMQGCDRDGFTCLSNPDGTVDIVFKCSDTQGVQHDDEEADGDVVDIGLFDFRFAPNARYLNIANCHTVNLHMKCSPLLSKLEMIHVSNIINLSFDVEEVTQSTPQMVFENISNIEIVPKGTFTQASRQQFRKGCHGSKADLKMIKFVYVNIGTIESGAFSNLEGILEISFVKCTVRKVEAGAFNVNVRTDGKFMIMDSTFGEVEDKAFHVVGRQILVSDMDFMELHSGGINTLCFKTDIPYHYKINF